MTDEEAVAQFEAFVLAQKPAEKPWTPVTDYSFEGRKRAEGKHPELIRDVFQPTRVLDAGCGPGHLVRMLRDIDVCATGCDVDTDTLPLVLRDAVWQGDIVQGGIGHRSYDLVICREVLEHLTVYQLRRAVRNIARASSQYVYVTTRYAQAPEHFLSFEASDNLDPTHISMGTKSFLRMLFVLEGFKSRPDLEAKMDWKNLGRCLVMERVA